MALGIPAIALFPYTDAKLRTEDGGEAFNADNLVCRATRAVRKAGPRHRRAARRGARPLHQPRPRRPDARRRDPQRRDAARPRAPDAGAGRGRLRHHRPLRHDGRPHRRHPQGARGCGPPERADHGLRRQVCLRLLRPVPRRGRLVRRAVGRQAHLPDGPRQHRRGAARGGARHRRGRRHGDGEARHALSRHRAPRERRVRRADLRLPGVRRVLDADGGRRQRLARRRQGDAGEPDGLQARRAPTACSPTSRRARRECFAGE